jgi:hypothetical protein
VARRARLALLAAAIAAEALAQEPSASVVLRWRSVPEAAAYELQIATDPAFAEPVVSERVPTAGYRWRTIPAERHFWRVRSVDAEGRLGPWSAVKAIERALRPPEPLAPGDRVRIAEDEGPLTLSWRASEIVREWVVEVARDPAFAEVVATLRSSVPRVRMDLPGPGRFHWRVRATDLSGGESGPSVPRSFEVRPSARPAARPPVASLVGPEPLPAGPAGPEALALAPAAAPAFPGEPAELAPPSRRGRFGAGILAGWATNLGALSAPTVGAEALWRPGPAGLALSLRVSWCAETATVPAQPGLPDPLEARAQVFPLSLLALYEWPLGWAVLHGGAGLSAQLAHLSVGDDAAVEAAAGVALAAGASRRLGGGEALAEVTFSTGSVDGSLGSLRTGGLQLLAGYRFRR